MSVSVTRGGVGRAGRHSADGNAGVGGGGAGWEGVGDSGEGGVTLVLPLSSNSEGRFRGVLDNP